MMRALLSRTNGLAAAMRERAEGPVLLAFLVVVASAWVFVALAGEVLEGDTRALDRDILLALRSAADPTDPLGGPRVEELFRDATALGGTGTLVMMTLFTVGFLWLRGRRRSILLLLGSIGTGVVFYRGLKMLFDRPRPDLVPHGSYVYTESFPSGHTFMATVVFLTLALMVARTQSSRTVRLYLLFCAAVLIALVGISRVYLGVHWPTDVLAGWTSGGAWALAWWLLGRWLAPSRGPSGA